MKNTDNAPAGVDPELISRLVASYGLEPALAERIVEDVLISFGATVEEWVRSRHIRLQRQGLKNDDIYRIIGEEAACAPLFVGSAVAPTDSAPHLRLTTRAL
jgi:hypothetical protein